MPAYERKLPTTGYWIFVCNTSIWAGDEFLATGETELWYRISKHHRLDFRQGQLGIFRLNEDRRSKKKLHGRPSVHAGVYAIFEIIDPKPRFGSDKDTRFYHGSTGPTKSYYQVRVRVTENLLMSPVLTSSLPKTKEFQYVHRPLQTPTIALSRSAFEKIISDAGLSSRSGPAFDDPVDTAEAIFIVENKWADATPEMKLAVSRRVERGPVGTAVKAYRKYRCQLCEALKKDPVAFLDRHGKPYAEAHHIIPVSRLLRGSLSHLNIMVLCPNHHRQAHYGDFTALEEVDHWSIQLDGTKLKIDKLQVAVAKALITLA